MEKLLLLNFVIWIILAFIVACLGLCFNIFQKEGMIFHFYNLWLTKQQEQEILYEFKETKRVCCNPKIKIIKYIPNLIIGKLAKPLGLCPYCNTTWIAIVVWVYYYSFTWAIFLFIGITIFFIRLLIKKLNYN